MARQLPERFCSNSRGFPFVSTEGCGQNRKGRLEKQAEKWQRAQGISLIRTQLPRGPLRIPQELNPPLCCRRTPLYLRIPSRHENRERESAETHGSCLTFPFPAGNRLVAAPAAFLSRNRSHGCPFSSTFCLHISASPLRSSPTAKPRFPCKWQTAATNSFIVEPSSCAHSSRNSAIPLLSFLLHAKPQHSPRFLFGTPAIDDSSPCFVSLIQENNSRPNCSLNSRIKLQEAEISSPHSLGHQQEKQQHSTTLLLRKLSDLQQIPLSFYFREA